MLLEQHELVMGDVAVARTPQVMRLASLTLDDRSPRFLRHLQALDCPSKRHWSTVERICSELTATERDYVSDLLAIVERFLDPLMAFAAQYLDGDVATELPALTALHNAAHVILGVHQELLLLLEPPIRPSQRRQFHFGELQNSPTGPRSLATVTRVTRAFAATIEYMKVYALYCAHYLPATEELNTHPKLLAAFTQAQEGTGNHLGVDAVSDLIKPVQRICRYSLLFRSLVKNATQPEETAMLEQTLDSVQRVSDLVNARVREAENNARLIRLHLSIDKPKLAAKLQLLRPGRTLLCEMTAVVQVTDRYARVARALHLPTRFHGRRHYCQQPEAGVGSEAELLAGSTGPDSEREACALRDSLGSCAPHGKCAHGGDQQRLVLMSDALLIAKKGDQRLRVRRHVCLSCAVVIEASEGDGSSSSCARSFALVASKTGRCNCHNLTPSTLQRLRRRRTSRSGVEGNNLLEASTAPSAGVRRTNARAARQYIICCESERKKSEFVALLRGAAARCARSRGPARLGTGLSAKRLPGKLWQSFRRSDFSTGGMRRRRAPAETEDPPEVALGSGDSEASGASPQYHTERLLRASRSATSGAA
ncbi:hypothetical protein BBJ28_00006054 [Nothophytophthora sp. Chile5]|nr:hypothetical protein BBJ28_00006054 [Nothophytophthora sp. Chile5]